MVIHPRGLTTDTTYLWQQCKQTGRWEQRIAVPVRVVFFHSRIYVVHIGYLRFSIKITSTYYTSKIRFDSLVKYWYLLSKSTGPSSPAYRYNGKHLVFYASNPVKGFPNNDLRYKLYFGRACRHFLLSGVPTIKKAVPV